MAYETFDLKQRLENVEKDVEHMKAIVTLLLFITGDL